MNKIDDIDNTRALCREAFDKIKNKCKKYRDVLEAQLKVLHKNKNRLIRSMIDSRIRTARDAGIVGMKLISLRKEFKKQSLLEYEKQEVNLKNQIRSFDNVLMKPKGPGRPSKVNSIRVSGIKVDKINSSDGHLYAVCLIPVRMIEPDLLLMELSHTFVPYYKRLHEEDKAGKQSRYKYGLHTGWLQEKEERLSIVKNLKFKNKGLRLASLPTLVQQEIKKRNWEHFKNNISLRQASRLIEEVNRPT